MFLVVALVSCTNADPQVKLAKASAPTCLGGSAEISITNLLASLEVPGACSSVATSLEWSSDGGTVWKSGASLMGSDVDCKDQVFKLLFSPQSDLGFVLNQASSKNIKVRQVTKAGSTGACDLKVTYSPSALPQISVSNVSFSEGATASFTLTLNQSSTQSISVNWATADGTAVAANGDYSASSGIATFLPGVMTATVSVPLGNDSRDDYDLTFSLNLSGAVGAAIGVPSAVATILDDDAAPILSINSLASLTEGTSGQFVVSLSAVSDKPVSFDWSTAGGSAISSVDFTATTQSGVTIVPGATSVFLNVVPTIDDPIYEITETFTAVVSNLTNATAGTLIGTATLMSSDPMPNLSVNDVSVVEGGVATFTISMDRPSYAGVTFTYSTADGTAIGGVLNDYISIPGSNTTISAGTTATFVIVSTNDDNRFDISKNFSFLISSAAGANIADSNGVATITDNDAMPNLSITSGPAVVEGGSLSFTVSIDAVSDANVSFDFNTLTGTADATDFTTESQSHIIFAGNTSINISVGTIDDSSYEPGPNENMLAQVSNVTNAVVVAGSVQGFISDNDPQPVTVTHLYSNAQMWNQYVINDNAEPLNVSGTACAAGTGTKRSACLHGGEKRVVVFNGPSSCTGYSITDALGAFDWQCRAFTGYIKFYTDRLKTTKRLADLLGSSAWLNNSVSILNNSILVGISSPAMWWSNPVSTVSGPALQQLNTANSINIVNNNMNTNGIGIQGQGVALVIKPGFKLTLNSGSNNFAGITCNTSGVNTRAAICAKADFLWIEGLVDPVNSASSIGLYSYGSNFSVFRNFSTDNASTSIFGTNFNKNLVDMGAHYYGGNGFMLTNSVGNEFTNLTVSDCIYDGFTLSSSSGNYVKNLLVQNCLDAGISLLSNSANNLFESTITQNNVARGLDLVSSINNGFVNFRSSNNSGEGIFLAAASTGNRFYQVTSTNNGSDGIGLLSSDSNYFAQVISAQNDGSGFFAQSSNTLSLSFSGFYNNLGSTNGVYLQNSTNNILNHVTTLNNYNGVNLVGVSNTKLSQIVSAYNTLNVKLDAGTSSNSTNAFVGALVVDTTSCSTSGSSAVLYNGTCSVLGNEGQSLPGPSGTLRIKGGLNSYFQGPIGVGDSTNPYDNTSGNASAISILDWGAFDNYFRVWSPSSTFGVSSRGSCSFGLCFIWDFRVKASDTNIFNRSGNGSSLNQTFTAGSACPTEVHGNIAVTPAVGGPFLSNAMEYFDYADGIGDDDGLCESGETCIYQPHFGPYLGEGGLSSSCTFQAGTVTGVTMRAYNTLGAP